jgi:hypothetical protein
MGIAADSTLPLNAPAPVEAGRVSRVVRVLPSLTDVAFILPILFVFGGMRGAYSLLGDADTGWHLRTGEWILANGRVPRTDIFSYTRPGEPWFAWEWGWDVLFARLYQSFGMASVVLASMLIISLTTALLFRLVRRKADNLFVAFVVTALSMAVSSLHWLARPHLFTLLFGVIFFSILERVRDAQASGDAASVRRIAWLPALTIVWANLHAGFFLGLILIGCYAAGELITALTAPAAEERRAAIMRMKPYLLAAAGCLAASFVNPYFYHLHGHLLSYLAGGYHYQHISEFQSISFHFKPAWLFEIMIVLGAVAAFRNLRRGRYVYVILIAGWTHLALVSGRNIPIFMMLAAPVVAATLCELLHELEQARVAGWIRAAVSRLDRAAAEVDETDRISRLHLASAAALVCVGLLLYAPAPPEKFQADYDAKAYPAEALRFLSSAGINGHIFTHDEWGDYLIYKLYPTKVFVDGRSDFYGDRFCLQYQDVLNVKYDWEQSLRQYAVDTVLLPPNLPLAGALKESRRWRLVYDDGVALVFRAASDPARQGQRVSAIQVNSGTGRDREITKSDQRDQEIPKTTT